MKDEVSWAEENDSELKEVFRDENFYEIYR